MDINEVSDRKINRHPWELSRTRCVLREILPAILKTGNNAKFVSIGAGDMYFDKHILRIMKDHTLYAVDIGYDTEKFDLVKSESDRIKMFSSLESVGKEVFEYSLMLDSLEYMQDDAEYLNQLCDYIKDGGYMFFTLPAFGFMFSKHDEIVGNLRRYSIRSFKDLIVKVGKIELISAHYFYKSLFVIRLAEKLLGVDIDPEHKVTTGWKYGKSSIVTCFAVGILNLDYLICRGLSKIGIPFPGLSMIAICRKL